MALVFIETVQRDSLGVYESRNGGVAPDQPANLADVPLDRPIVVDDEARSRPNIREAESLETMGEFPCGNSLVFYIPLPLTRGIENPASFRHWQRSEYLFTGCQGQSNVNRHKGFEES